ncbi:unnamed protein product, partial [Protopolystoma xenopodis]
AHIARDDVSAFETVPPEERQKDTGRALIAVCLRLNPLSRSGPEVEGLSLLFHQLLLFNTTNEEHFGARESSLAVGTNKGFSVIGMESTTESMPSSAGWADVWAFPLLLFAQTLCAVAQVFILGLPAQLAAVWFAEKEVASATAAGVFGNQVMKD